MIGSRPLDHDEYLRIRRRFSGRNALRNRVMFGVGVNTGYRISEILVLRRGDVIDRNGEIVERLVVQRRAMKGRRESRSVVLCPEAREDLRQLLGQMDRAGHLFEDDWLFRSRAGNRAISRAQAFRVLMGAFNKEGLVGKLATHCMRKTFANKVYDFNLGLVAAGEKVDAFRATSRALGHSDIKSTDKYLSFRSEQIDEAVMATGW